MKGTMGLLVAVFLGVLGGVLNLLYLNSGGESQELVEFIGIKSGADVKRGEVFRESHFQKVGIPRRNAGNLLAYAVLYSDRAEVVGYRRATRDYKSGELLLHRDIQTPPQNVLQELKTGERAVFVPIDTRKFIPSLVVPGVTRVSFRLPSDDGVPELLGPFEVLSVGNRFGSTDTMTAANIPQKHENVLTILAAPEVEAKIAQLQTHLLKTNDRPLDVDVHPASGGVR